MNGQQHKGLILILDGLGDYPSPALGGLTPLQHAKTPYLDNLAANNVSGLMDPLAPGVPVDTHTGVGMLFGLTPAEACQLSRGPIEAAGIGLEMSQGDVIFRGNLCTINDQDDPHQILDRRAGRILEGVEELCASLQDVQLAGSVTASVYPATHHRCVVKLSGSNLSHNITDTDPGGQNISAGIQKARAMRYGDSEAEITANAINEFTSYCIKVLGDHPVNAERRKINLPPANAIILRGGGYYRHYQNVLRHLDLDVAVIAAESTILGLGKLFNFKTHTEPEFTALVDTDLVGKLKAAVNALDEQDLVFVHVKGTDSAAHDRDPEGKSRLISRLDQALSEVDLSNLVVGVCADHSTDSNSGEHTGDPVPVLIHSPLGRQDSTVAFNEYDCANGALTRITAQGFLVSVLNAMGRLPNIKPADAEYFNSGF